MSKEQPIHFLKNDSFYQEKFTHACNLWEKQISLYLRLGFPRILQMNTDEYILSIPKFRIPPKEKIERFSKPLLVEPRISPQIQLRLAGYKYSVNGKPINNVEIPKNSPYLVWAQDGSKKDLNENIAPYERSITLLEGAALLLGYPDILDGHHVALLGSSIFSEGETASFEKVPCVYKWSDGKIGIGSDFRGYLEDDNARLATCLQIT